MVSLVVIVVISIVVDGRMVVSDDVKILVVSPVVNDVVSIVVDGEVVVSKDVGGYVV